VADDTGIERLDENDMLRKLEDRTHELIGHLKNDDLGAAFTVIQQINATKEEGIYHGLGVLARGLHTAINSFELEDSGKAYLAHGESGALHVSGQLDNVVKMSEESARKTLDVLDKAMPLVRELIANAEQLVAESPRSKLAKPLATNAEGLKQVDAYFTEILMAQGFQDLAGQAIKKVTALLDDTQHNLVHLLKYANEVKSLTIPLNIDELKQGVTPGAKKQEAEEKKAEEPVAGESPMGQDDVDDLLSSLGF
jgi:chemotaxis protein CheZ